MISAVLRPIGERMTTGIPTLDAATRGGIPLGRLVVVAGAPGAAKTTFATSLMDRWERAGADAVFLAADELASGIVTRLGQLSGFAREQLENEGPECDATRSAFAQSAVGRRIIVIDPDAHGGAHTIEDAHAVLLHVADGRPRVLVVDSLQTATCAAANGHETIRERMDAKIATLKAFAKSGTLVLAISEMARAGYRSGDRSQDISALAAGKESGSIEYGVSLLLGLRSVKGETGLVNIEVAKNRLGSSKPELRVRLDFDRASFSEIATADADEERASNSDAKHEAALGRVREVVRANSNLKSQNDILALCKGNRTVNHDAVRELALSGELIKVAGYLKLNVTEREARHAAE